MWLVAALINVVVIILMDKLVLQSGVLRNLELAV